MVEQADADRGMAELLEDLDMVPRARNTTDDDDDDDDRLEREEAGRKGNKGNKGRKNHRKRRALAPPGGNAKSRYAKLMARKKKREWAEQQLANITSGIQLQLTRGLGVSGAMLEEVSVTRCDTVWHGVARCDTL